MLIRFGKPTVLIGLFCLVGWLHGQNAHVDAIHLQSAPVRIGFNKERQILGIGERSGEVLLWDLKNKRPLRRFDHTHHYVDGIAFSMSGTQVVILKDEDSFYEYSKATGSASHTSFGPKRRGVRGRVFNVETGRENGVLRDFSDGICGATFDPSGRWFVAWSRGGIHVWETASWQHVKTYQGFFGSSSKCFDFSPDGKVIAVAKDDGNVVFLGFPMLDVRGKVKVGNKPLDSVAFINDGKECICCGPYGTISLIDPSKQTLLSSMAGFGVLSRLTALQQKGCVAVVDEGLASDPGGDKVRVICFDPKTNASVYTATTDWITALASFGDIETLAIGLNSGDVVFVKLAVKKGDINR
jgi:WD40 repeat protein